MVITITMLSISSTTSKISYRYQSTIQCVGIKAGIQKTKLTNMNNKI